MSRPFSDRKRNWHSDCCNTVPDLVVIKQPKTDVFFSQTVVETTKISFTYDFKSIQMSYFFSFFFQVSPAAHFQWPPQDLVRLHDRQRDQVDLAGRGMVSHPWRFFKKWGRYSSIINDDDSSLFLGVAPQFDLFFQLSVVGPRALPWQRPTPWSLAASVGDQDVFSRFEATGEVISEKKTHLTDGSFFQRLIKIQKA